MQGAAARRGFPLVFLGVWAAFLLGPDLLTFFLDPTGEMSARMLLVYAVTMGASATLWIAALGALSRLRARHRWLGWTAVAAFAFAIAATAGTTLLYRVYFDYNPKPVIVAFFFRNAAYVSSLLATSTSRTFQLAVVGVPLFFLGVVTWVTRTPTPPLTSSRAGRGALALAVAIELVWLAFPTKVSSSSPDLIGVKAVGGGAALALRGTALPMLPRPRRAPVAPAPATHRPSVLFIVHESIGRKQVAPWAEGAPDSETARFLRAHEDHTVWFPRATTVAPVTNVAFPSILSGQSPEAPYASFERAPLMWHDAAAAGYMTALFSAEDYKYSFFRGFFLANDAPQTYQTAGEIEHPRTVDSGVDDARAADLAIDFLNGAPRDKPFFVVVQFNGSHFPCWNPKNPNEPVSTFDDAARKKRCDLAIEHIDHQVGRLLAALDGSQRLEETLVISTADHGETFEPTRPKRPINFYEDTMGVPLAVHVPKSLVSGEPAFFSALRDNRPLRVSNLDVYPTLLDLWGKWPLTNAGGERPPLSGTSLFKPVPADRVLASTARGSIYEPPVQGFALYRGSTKWLFDEKRGLQMFDLDRDPDERADRAGEASPEARAFFEATVRARPHLLEPLRAKPPSWLTL